MENPERLPDPSSKRPPSENMKPLMEMLDILDTPSTPPTRLERLRASWHQYAPRVPAVAGSFWGKAVLGVVAAAALGGTMWHFAHRKPAAPVIAHERPIHAGPAHTK